jgi:hypothetical protein
MKYSSDEDLTFSLSWMDFFFIKDKLKKVLSSPTVDDQMQLVVCV